MASGDICLNCDQTILTMVFRGSGFCSDLCKKAYAAHVAFTSIVHILRLSDDIPLCEAKELGLEEDFIKADVLEPGQVMCQECDVILKRLAYE